MYNAHKYTSAVWLENYRKKVIIFRRFVYFFSSFSFVQWKAKVIEFLLIRHIQLKQWHFATRWNETKTLTNFNNSKSSFISLQFFCMKPKIIVILIVFSLLSRIARIEKGNGREKLKPKSLNYQHISLTLSFVEKSDAKKEEKSTDATIVDQYQ